MPNSNNQNDGYQYSGQDRPNSAYEYPVTTAQINSVFGRKGIVEARSSDYSKYYQTLSATLTEFSKLILSPTSQGYLTWDGTTLAISAGGEAGTGTVTSVALSAPNLFSVSGSPVTGFGTLSFSWNGSSANFVLADGSSVPTSTYALASALSGYATTAALAAYQPLDADLTAIGALGGIGLLKRTGTNTWSLDTTAYLTPTSNAATASKLLSPILINNTLFDGSNSISFNTDSVLEGSSNLYYTLARVLTSPLTGYSVGSNAAIAATDTILIAFGKIQSQIDNTQPKNTILQSISNISQSQTGLIKLTNGVASLDSNVYALSSTLSNYQPLDADLTAIAGLVPSNGILRKTATNTWSLDTSIYLTENQSIGWTSSGDVSGSASGATSITPSLVVTGVQGKSITLANGFLKYNGTAWSFDNSSYQPLSSNLTTLSSLGNPSADGYVLSSTTTGTMSWVSISGGDGTVTSVGLTTPTIFTVSNSPVTSSGNISFSWNGTSLNFVRADGSTVATSTYALASALGSYLTISNASSTYLTISNAATAYQPLDGDLTSIAGLSGTSGLARKTAANSWTLDTSTYITANQAITWTGSGDVTGSASGATSISPSITVTGIQGKGITLANGLLRYNGTIFSFDNSTFLTANQNITISGDITGSGTTAITTTIAATTITGKALTGYVVGSNAVLAATDTILAAFGKIQSQINARPGTVTSVSLSTPSIFTVTGSPITSSGAISFSWNGSSTNLVRADGTTIPTNTYQPLATNLTTLAALGNPASNGYVLSSTTSGVMSWTPVSGGGGTVTSIGLTAPSIFTVSGSPVTTTGSLSFSWNGASTDFVRGDGSTVATSTYVLASALSSYLTTSSAASTYQPLDGDLTSIAALAGTTGLARKTSANTWSLDTTTYLTANQTITLSGDVTGSGSTAITSSIAASTITGKLLTGYSVGTNTALAATDSILVGFGKIQAQLNTKGVGSVTSVALSAPSIFTVSGSPVTSSGSLSFAWNGSSANFVLGDGTTTPISTYLTTIAAASSYQPLDGDLTAIAGLVGTSGIARKTAANTWSLDTAGYLTANQSITLTTSGDISGSASGTTSISPSLTVTGIRGKTITLGTGLLRYDGTVFSFDSSTFLTSNQSITLSGDISGTGTTSLAVTVNKILGNTVPVNGAGALTNNGSGVLSWTSYLTSAPTITLTGAVTGTGTGSFATSLSSGVVALSNHAALAANSIIGNNTGSSATPIALSVAQTQTMLNILTNTAAASTYQPLSAKLTSFAALAAPSVNGYVLSSTTAGSLSWVASGSGSAYTTTSPVTVSNTVTTTSLVSTSLTSSNQSPGSIVDVECEGTIKYNNLSNTLTMNILLGSNTLASLVLVGTDIDSPAINTDYHWKFVGRLSPQTGPSTTSNIALYGELKVVGTALSTIIDIAVVGTNINTTVSNNIIVNVTWSAASTNNSITSSYGLVDKIG